MKSKGIIVSGYFNPLHVGHIDYFKKSKNYGDKLFVIVNNDFQRKIKGSKDKLKSGVSFIFILQLYN
jgi:D-beta-D-heptose 7-phosphate kinase/D-beta-D-heptose 1-phosphate adenosyltransferase